MLRDFRRLRNSPDVPAIGYYGKYHQVTEFMSFTAFVFMHHQKSNVLGKELTCGVKIREGKRFGFFTFRKAVGKINKSYS